MTVLSLISKLLQLNLTQLRQPVLQLSPSSIPQVARTVFLQTDIFRLLSSSVSLSLKAKFTTPLTMSLLMEFQMPQTLALQADSCSKNLSQPTSPTKIQTFPALLLLLSSTARLASTASNQPNTSIPKPSSAKNVSIKRDSIQKPKTASFSSQT